MYLLGLLVLVLLIENEPEVVEAVKGKGWSRPNTFSYSSSACSVYFLRLLIPALAIKNDPQAVKAVECLRMISAENLFLQH